MGFNSAFKGLRLQFYVKQSIVSEGHANGESYVPLKPL